MATGKEWLIDLNRITFGEYPALEADMLAVDQLGDMRNMAKWYARCIVRWPLEGDPADEAGYVKLGMVDFMEAAIAFRDAYFRLFQKLATRLSVGTPNVPPDEGVRAGTG